MKRRLAAAALTAALCWGALLPAQAGPTTQTSALCDGAPHGCSLSFDKWIREGVAYPVVVKGRPGARVKVVAYQASVDGGRVTKLTAISTGGDVTVPTSGVATAQVTIPPLHDGLTGGWALISLGGLTGSDTSEAIGGFVPLGSRTPVLLGDGFGSRKPAGEVLDLRLAGTIAGNQFAVDYRDDAGAWHDVTATAAANQTAVRPGDVATVRYEMPRGLAPHPYDFRLRNLNSGTAEVTWRATPDTNGVPEKPTVWGPAPKVGAQAAGAGDTTSRPSTVIEAAAAGVGGLALLIVLIGVPLATRRGRVA